MIVLATWNQNGRKFRAVVEEDATIVQAQSQTLAWLPVDITEIDTGAAFVAAILALQRHQLLFPRGLINAN